LDRLRLPLVLLGLTAPPSNDGLVRLLAAAVTVGGVSVSSAWDFARLVLRSGSLTLPTVFFNLRPLAGFFVGLLPFFSSAPDDGVFLGLLEAAGVAVFFFGGMSSGAVSSASLSSSSLST
jgi:hypothetical protein